MHFNIYDVFSSQCSQLHVSAGIVDIFIMILLQEYKRTTLVNSVTVSHSVAMNIIVTDGDIYVFLG